MSLYFIIPPFQMFFSFLISNGKLRGVEQEMARLVQCFFVIVKDLSVPLTVSNFECNYEQINTGFTRY